jgi:hypothetical protein
MIAPGATLPAAFGVGAASQNSGSLRTSGWEVELNYNHNFKHDAYFYGTLTLSDYQSKITEWTGNDSKMLYTNYKGKKIGEIWVSKMQDTSKMLLMSLILQVR